MKYLLIILILTSCVNSKTIHYRVKAGEHSSGVKVNVLKKDVISYSFTTDSSWVWDVPQLNGFSKVTGIAWNSNHQNSVRVVYMRLDTIGVLAYYYYLNGVSPQQNHVQKGVLDTIVIGHTYAGRLGWDNGFYFITLNDKQHSMKVGYPFSDVTVKTLQNLYVGGTYTIDHDWTSKVTIK